MKRRAEHVGDYGSDDDGELQQHSPVYIHRRKENRIIEKNGSTLTNLRVALNSAKNRTSETEDLMYFLNKAISGSEQFGSSNIIGRDSDRKLIPVIRGLVDAISPNLRSKVESRPYKFKDALTSALIDVGGYNKGNCCENAYNVLMLIGKFLLNHPRDRYPQIRALFDKYEFVTIWDSVNDHQFVVALKKGHKIFSNSRDDFELPNFPSNTVVVDTWTPNGPPVFLVEKADPHLYMYLKSKDLYRYRNVAPKGADEFVTKELVEDNIYYINPIEYAKSCQIVKELLQNNGYTKEYIKSEVEKEAALLSKDDYSLPFNSRNTTQRFERSDYLENDKITSIVERNRSLLYPNSQGSRAESSVKSFAKDNSSSNSSQFQNRDTRVR